MTYSFGMSKHFTPDAIAAAVVGGLLLGCSVAFKTSALGGVLGVSTYTKRMVLQVEAKRYFFIAGMILAGLAMSSAYGPVEPVPPSGMTARERATVIARMYLGAALVGMGSMSQCGCTSGHGLTGLARLSLRSWVAVPTFMATGIITATLSQAAQAFPPDDTLEAYLPEWSTGAGVASSLAGILAAVAAVTWCVGHHGGEDAIRSMSCVGELLIGATFGCGLVISGMSRPSKVAAFLDVGSGAWDLSLAFVMGGALLVTFPYFQVLERLQDKAFLHPLNFDLPSVEGRLPDRDLLIGAVLFGAGWGLGGMCPGPIWVNVGAMHSLEVLVAVLGLFSGIMLHEALQAWRSPPREVRQSDEGLQAGPGAGTLYVAPRKNSF